MKGGLTMFRMARRLSPVLIAALLLSTLCCSMTKDKEAAARAVEKFHGQLNQEQYHDIYAQASEEFRKATSEEELTTFLSAVHRKLGALKSADQTGWHVNYTTFGTIVTLGYDSTFDEGKAAEQFIWRVSGDQAILIRYDINSPAFIMK
jgi:hypothetical protein